MDAEYLKASVGTVLSAGIAETVLMRPDDPVDYLAQFMLKSVADDSKSKVLREDVVEAEKVLAAKTDVARAVKAKEDAKQHALAEQSRTEDKRLATLLSSVKSPNEAYNVVLSYTRQRYGASGFVALTDLPEKVSASACCRCAFALSRAPSSMRS